MPKVTIDGKQVTVAEEATILEAATKAGVWIPTLCHVPALAGQASCRICMVAIERRGRRDLVTACNYPVRQDLVVHVADEVSTRVRRGVMELMLARCPESRVLRELAARMGVSGTRYPTVTTSQRNCILCGLCVAVCGEIIGKSAIGFQGRGVERVVGEPFGVATGTCIACGACVAVCPVGTIEMHPEDGFARLEPFQARVELRPCASCGRRWASPDLAAAVAARSTGDWEGLKTRAGLCPECRRKRTAASMTPVALSRRER